MIITIYLWIGSDTSTMEF